MIKESRIKRLQGLAAEQGIDSVIIVPGASMFYLLGFSMGMSERPAFAIIPQQGEPTFFCPAFEAEKIRRGTGMQKLITWTEEAGPLPALREALGPKGLGQTVALEYRACRMMEFDLAYQATEGFAHVDARPLLAEMRMAKDAEEEALMQRAADAANVMLDGIKNALVPGMTEKELQKAALDALNKAYPEAQVAFVTVVSGEKTALPHATTGTRRVEPNDIVMADLGAVIGGYASDITRTFVIGPLDSELEEAYELVLKANQAAREAAKPGMTAGELDAIARKVIADAGYGEYFTHRLGHGLGLEVHEEPYIVGGSNQVLKEGHTFTIEPGIYMTGKGGVRIEDDVIMTAEGVKSLTTYPRDLRIGR